MKKIEIEWRHLDVDGKTCARCAGTGNEIRQLVSHLHEVCASRHVHVTLKEVRLAEGEIEESNRIFINGMPLEEILPETGVSQNECPSCSDLLKSATCCRTLIHGGTEYKTIPRELIREAVCKIARCC